MWNTSTYRTLREGFAATTFLYCKTCFQLLLLQHSSHFQRQRKTFAFRLEGCSEVALTFCCRSFYVCAILGCHRTFHGPFTSTNAITSVSDNRSKIVTAIRLLWCSVLRKLDGLVGTHVSYDLILRQTKALGTKLRVYPTAYCIRPQLYCPEKICVRMKNDPGFVLLTRIAFDLNQGAMSLKRKSSFLFAPKYWPVPTFPAPLCPARRGP